jgi:hypothetical protein
MPVSPFRKDRLRRIPRFTELSGGDEAHLVNASYVGEYAKLTILANQPRPATPLAMFPTNLLEMLPDRFLACMRANRDFALATVHLVVSKAPGRCCRPAATYPSTLVTGLRLLGQEIG